ncbi:GATA zinc finger domain-containing protein 14-like [Octopus sinensis]|uniref:GATA zinc finger domain-containing protein 14-like n=1 Tax=Octopus sinensis TaxID=2607531 RepID=A0A6P7TDK8_9MOLL|nr:GATA zinc finger domain-containing protein 14-like [Octopus sinensis]
MNKKKKPQIKESLIEVEEIKINSSVCESSMNAEENPSELLSPDSTTVTKTVSNYTPSSTDESPSGSNGENTCEKSVNYDPYDITLALEESEPIKSFRAIDSSKTFCQPNSSQVVASYPGKMIEKTQSSPTEMACSTSIHSHNQSNRLSSRLSPTSTGATSSNCISSNNGNSKNNRSRSNSIIDQQKSLQLACNSQPTSNEDNILPKNTYSNRQLNAGSQSVSVGSMSLPRSQQHSYSRQSQHIAQPSLSPVSMPSPISNISTAVEPETNSSVSQNVISNSSAQIASPCTSEQNNYSSPNSLRYSAESLFNTSTKLNTAPPKSHPQPLNQTLIPQDSSNIISNSIAGRNDNSRVDKTSYSSGSAFSSNNTHHIATSESDALNFANLGLTLTPTVPSNTFTDSSVCNSSTSFTFSLPNSNNTSLFPSHHFPFLHLHSLVTPQLLHGENNESSSNQQSQTFGLPSFGLNNQKNNNETESNIPHQNTSNEQNIICGSSSSSSTASSHLQSHNTFNFGLSNSLETCSISRSQPYTDGSNISLNTINLEKSSSNTISQSNDGSRTVSNQKHLPNISQSISLSNRNQQSSLNSVDCSSQITSSVSTYFSPMNYQSLHTPPLHHPPVTSNENSRANISRSFNANLPTSISNFGSSTPVFNSRFDSNQLLFHSQRDAATVSQNVNINPEISKSTSSQQQNTVSKAAKQQASQQTLSLSQSQLSQGSLSSHQSTPSSISDNNATLTLPQQIPNTSSTVLKSSDISTSFNSIFPPSRSQNGIGLNFQTGFGMNTVHNGPTNTPQIPPHSSAMPNLPHVPSLGLGNIFSDVNSTSQNEALNISPIKFPTNSILPPPQASIDPNSLQHHHQGGALYHNRSHPPPPPVIHNMSINSILSHNPHGFEPRGPVAQAINSTVTPSGFHGPSHSSFPIPPLNFSIHEH